MTTMMMKQELPEELITDILWRLPISDCARFRCVCKSWRALLSDLSFILRDDKSVDSRRLQIMINFRSSNNKRSVYSLYYADTLEPLLPSPVLLPRMPQIQRFIPGPPSDYDPWDLQVAGSCNGLICISNGHHKLLLWNPATSETKVIPHSPFERYYILKLTAVGFGFDSETNDYKILTQFDNDDNDSWGGWRCFLDVYSLRNNSWTKLRDDDDDNSGNDNGYKPWLPSGEIPQCHKGKLYWWCLRRYTAPKESLRFDSFDMSSQEFEKLDLPCPFENIQGITKCLLKEESMVALFPIHDIRSEDMYPKSWEIWALLKYWVSESWTKLFVITTNSPPGMRIWNSVGISRNLKCLCEAVHSSKMREGYNYYFHDDNVSFTAFHPATGEFSDLVQIQARRLLFMIDYIPSQVCIRDYCMST